MSAPTYLTSSELAQRWRLHPKTLANWRVRGAGPTYFKVGDGQQAHVLYELAVIEEWERKRVQEAGK
jgi:hypothetical protein